MQTLPSPAVNEIEELLMKSFMRASMVMLFAFVLSAAMVSASESQINVRDFKEEINKEVVTQAFKSVLVNADASALERYWIEEYVQHNPLAQNGRDALKEIMIDNRPEGLEYEIGSVFAEGDFVAVHGRVKGLGENPMIVVDIVKVINGKIVEHWDVLQEEVPVEETASGNPMFPIEGSKVNSSKESENRRLVIGAMNRLMGMSDSTVIDEFWSEDYIQHNPLAENGSNVLKDFVSQMAPGAIKFEIGLAIAYGDYVLLHSRYSGILDNPSIAVDIFRLEDGKIKEHWDVVQEEVPLTETANGNTMFPVF
jgi:predicted SnoaL-like aldol condensation-catalyzing enzyme